MPHLTSHSIVNPVSLSHHSFHLIMNLISFSFASFNPYSGKGSTSQVLVWYNILTKETWGHICAAGFKPVLRLLPERFTSAVLAQTLAERWWDITHTFHVADQEMIITPHDFHRMTGLQFDKVLISLEDESGT